MPLPLIPLILGGVSLAATGIATYYINQNWDKVKKRFNGKNIIVLGQRATGKTTLINFLQIGKITLAHEPTTGISKVKKVKTAQKKLSELGWNIELAKIQKDYAGVTANYDQWLKAIQNADIFVYLFKIDEWNQSSENIESQILKDLEAINSVLSQKDIPVFIIATHLDKLESIEFHTEKEKLKFIDEIQNEVFFKGLKARLSNNNVHLHIGSMRDEVGLQNIIKFIIDQIED